LLEEQEKLISKLQETLFMQQEKGRLILGDTRRGQSIF
jgi:hypothetical protein